MPDDQKCIEPNEVYRLLALPDHLILLTREGLFIHTLLTLGWLLSQPGMQEEYSGFGPVSELRRHT